MWFESLQKLHICNFGLASKRFGLLSWDAMGSNINLIVRTRSHQCLNDNTSLPPHSWRTKPLPSTHYRRIEKMTFKSGSRTVFHHKLKDFHTFRRVLKAFYWRNNKTLTNWITQRPLHSSLRLTKSYVSEYIQNDPSLDQIARHINTPCYGKALLCLLDFYAEKFAIFTKLRSCFPLWWKLAI